MNYFLAAVIAIQIGASIGLFLAIRKDIKNVYDFTGKGKDI